MNVVGTKTVIAISKVTGIDTGDIDARSKIDEDLKMDDSDMESVLSRLERVLQVDLIDFYDASEIKTVGHLVRFIKEQMEM